MKIFKKIFLTSIFSVILLSYFLIPGSRAQPWIYNGADTERIPDFFVYPSERYYYNYTGGAPYFDEVYLRMDIIKGNITDTYMGMSVFPGLPPLVNGTSIWGDLYTGNATSSEEILNQANYQFLYWNETVGLISVAMAFIPVDTTGEATAQSLGIVLEAIQWVMEETGGRFEHNATYPNIYSVYLWNETNNYAYNKLNFTENGQLINFEVFNIPTLPNVTLISRPAQLSPIFTFSTEDDILAVNSTDLKLIVDTTDADNNNDKVIDADYQYRIYNGTVWTAWAAIPPLINYDLGPVAAGNYDITMEVKNMYGVASHQIQIQYTPPGDGDGGIPAIPGYSIVLISIALLIGVSFLIQKNRKKM